MPPGIPFIGSFFLMGIGGFATLTYLIRAFPKIESIARFSLSVQGVLIVLLGVALIAVNRLSPSLKSSPEAIKLLIGLFGVSFAMGAIITYL